MTLGIGTLISLAGSAGKLLKKGDKKWGWKFWAAIGGLILLLWTAIGIRHFVGKIAEQRRARLEAETALATQTGNKERLQIAYDNKVLELTRERAEKRKENCIELKIEERFPDGRVKISTTKICESTTHTIEHESQKEDVVLPPMAAPPVLSKLWPKWEYGLTVVPQDEGAPWFLGDIDYFIFRGVSLGVVGTYPLGIGIRVAVRR